MLSSNHSSLAAMLTTGIAMNSLNADLVVPLSLAAIKPTNIAEARYPILCHEAARASVMSWGFTSPSTSIVLK